ncbi:YceH family protein [Shewanella sp.]|uniref:YceH family protein n=1 Tax=Shewanella sp. TaxID=50422 RepID=UPI001ED45F0A|nr:YceH family protein [Shewanella sp.]NRB23358.1 YceH family protein [Shewanella sp.]
MNLTLHEARVIACLLEKEVTTPDQYPLSLNSLTMACNQKSSRDPVLAMTEAETQASIDALMKRRLVTDQTGFGSRVVKYKHRFCNTEFSDLQFNSAQLAIICLLLLRGPQTPGELKSRSGRLHPFHDVSEVDKTLDSLTLTDPALVRQLAKEPGRRDSRFIGLFSDEAVQARETDMAFTPTRAGSIAATESESATEENLAQAELVARVTTLERDVAQLKEALQDFLN